MRHDRRWRRRLARLTVAAAAAVATGAAATPAYAEPSGSVFAFLDDVIIGADGSPGKAVPIFVQGVDAVNPTLTIDLSGLDGIATAEFPTDDCELAGTTATCELPDNVEFFDVIPVVFRPVDGVADGEEGTLTYTTKADGIDPAEQTAKLTVKEGVDLVALSAEPANAKPGDDYPAPIAFGNLGNQATDAIGLLLSFSQGLVPDVYDNCAYDELGDAGVTVALCHFEGDFQPDESTIYVLEGGFGTTVAPDALDLETVDFFVSPSGEIELPQAVKLAEKGGKKLSLVAKKAQASAKAVEIDDRDNWGMNEVSVDNTLDLAAVGANLTGGVGDVVKAKVGLKNAGAGTLDSSRSGEPSAQFTVAVPAGAEVVVAPEVCDSLTEDTDGTVHGDPGKAGGTYYRCANLALLFRTGETFLVEFDLKIKSLDGAAGAVSLDDKYRDPVRFDDDNNANNTAAITIGGGDTGGAGGGLPVTGVKVGAIAAGGVALLALGAALFLVSRRRRVVLVADDSND